MALWQHQMDAKDINEKFLGSLAKNLGLRVTSISETSLTGELKVTDQHLQPFGLMNGGLSAVIGESLGSIASNFCVADRNSHSVGTNINAYHVRAAHPGDVLTGVATPKHLGGRMHVWEIEIKNQDKKLIANCVLTTAIISRG